MVCFPYDADVRANQTKQAVFPLLRALTSDQQGTAGSGLTCFCLCNFSHKIDLSERAFSLEDETLPPHLKYLHIFQGHVKRVTYTHPHIADRRAESALSFVRICLQLREGRASLCWSAQIVKETRR